MSVEHFTPEMAAAYDDRFKPLVALKDALHLMMQGVLAHLPADARVLCVGAGTGADLLALAAAYPDWRFTVVEPAQGMIDVCRQRAAAAGITDRCAFRHGYLDSLPATDPHHAAVTILVSQFIQPVAARCAFYQQIAARLVPDGALITGDLVVDDPAIWPTWLAMIRLLGSDDAKLAKYRVKVEEAVALVTGDALRAMLGDAGFDAPQRIYQAGMIQAHLARRGPGS